MVEEEEEDTSCMSHLLRRSRGARNARTVHLTDSNARLKDNQGYGRMRRDAAQ